MLSDTLQAFHPDLIKFILVTVFSLLIGLEQRRLHIDIPSESLFGTDRTFTLVGILGFILYVISPVNLIPFLGGGLIIIVLSGIFYFQKIQQKKFFGATTLILVAITYCMAPLVYCEPLWLALLVVVCVLVLTELKETLLQFTKKVDADEFITLAKFLLLAGVILPLLPNQPISPEVNIIPFKLGLAIVVVSAISYFSYLLKKFVFPDSGILLSGLLGGLYSSTATTVILARKSKEEGANKQIVAAILLANAMMYLRIFLLALFFNSKIAVGLAPYLGIFMFFALAMAFLFIRFDKTPPVTAATDNVKPHSNPLEFKTAMLFGALFIVFGVITTYVSKHYGGAGINIMAYVVGITDINPFILNLFQSKWDIANMVIIIAVVNAITSNNLMQMIYALILSDKSLRKQLITGFSVLIAVGLIFAFVTPLQRLFGG